MRLTQPRLYRAETRGKNTYTKLLKTKTPAEIEAIWIQKRPEDKTSPTSISPDMPQYPPFMLKKFMEYNSSTPQDILVSCIKELKSLEPTQAEIANLINAPANISPETQLTEAPT